MGLDVYTYLRIAVPLTSDELLRPTSKEITCAKGHKKTGPAPFCDQDGTKFTEKVLKEPLPGFEAYCKKEDLDPDPEEAFLPNEGEYGWGNVQPQDGSEDRHPKTHLTKNVIELGRRGRSNEIDWDEITKERKKLEDLVEKLIGVRRPSGVYICTYYSY